MYPGSKIDSKLIKQLINLAYWPIYGEMTFNDLVLDPSLSSESVFYSYLSTIIYVCIANVLLLNLLIAMFRYLIYI